MNLVLSGCSIQEIMQAIEELRTVFVVLRTAYYVAEDATVQVYVCLKLPISQSSKELTYL